MLTTLANLIVAAAVFAQAPIDTISPITPSMTDPRKLAEQLLVEKWLPLVTRDPDAFHTRGIDIKEPRLGEPFLEAWLQGDDLIRYRDSSVSDPRPFANQLNYAFPIHVAGRDAPVMWLIVFRNRDENVRRAMPDNVFRFMGYYFGGGGMTDQAVRIREQHDGRITFVSFVDTGMRTVIVETPANVLMGFSEATARGFEQDPRLTTLGEMARRVKNSLRHQRAR